MSDRSIFFDRYGALQINAYACRIDKSTLPNGSSCDSAKSPYFGTIEKPSGDPLCSLLDSEAAQYNYKIPSTVTDSATSKVGLEVNADKNDRKPVTFRPLFTTGLSTNIPVRSCIKSKSGSSNPVFQKNVKFKLDPKPFTRGIVYQRDPTVEQNLRHKLNKNVPITTHRSALSSSRQYPDPQSRYIFNKYAHLFGLTRKPEFNLNRSQPETK